MLRMSIAVVCTFAWSTGCSDTQSPLRPPPDDGRALEDAGAPLAEAAALDADGATPDAGEPTALPLVCKVEPCFQRVVGNGSSAVCALTTTGKVWCWGSDGKPDAYGSPSQKGSLGRGASVIDPTLAATPMPIPSLDSIVELSIGRDDVSCALRDDGTVWCWGTKPEYGFDNPPTRVSGLDTAVHVVVDIRMGCAILNADRSAWCWGPPGIPLLPEGSDGRPTRVGPIVTRPVRQIGLAAERLDGNMDALLLLMEDRSIVSWGSAPGRPSSLAGGTDRTPAEIDAVSHGWWVGAFRFLADGRAYAWGATPADVVAHAVPQLDGASVLELGERIAVDAKGNVFVWGTNGWGELGHAPETLLRADAPVAVTLPEKARSVASAAGGAFCASLVDGNVVCWGENGQGQLGRRARDAEPHPEPERIAP